MIDCDSFPLPLSGEGEKNPVQTEQFSLQFN